MNNKFHTGNHKNNSRAICILGMHRSGTSTISRVLNLLGVYLGEEDSLIQPANRNPKGFWEHKEITEIQIRILKSFSCYYQGYFLMPYHWYEHTKIEPFKNSLKKIIKEEFLHKHLWGWKDPRTCVLLPMWSQIFQEINIECNFLIIFRNPIDVAKSLRKLGEQYTLERATHLWLVYTLSSLYESRNSKRAIIMYDELLDNWEYNLKIIVQRIDIPWPEDEKRTGMEINNFLEHELRHSKSNVKDMEDNIELNLDLLLPTYDLCMRASASQELLDSPEFKENINDLYLDMVIRTKDLQINKLQDKFTKSRLSLDAIHNTLSWKLTSPLREIGKYILNKK